MSNEGDKRESKGRGRPNEKAIRAFPFWKGSVESRSVELINVVKRCRDLCHSRVIYRYPTIVKVLIIYNLIN